MKNINSLFTKKKNLIAYISLVFLIIIANIFILSLLGYIKLETKDTFFLILLITIFSRLYHENKPNSFINLLNKYTGIKFPTWKDFQIKVLGIDPKILDKEKRNKNFTFQDKDKFKSNTTY